MPGHLVSVIDTFNVTIELGDFTVQELMEGRSDAKPNGDILDFDLDLALPSGARLNDIIDPDFAITDYLWLIEIKLDSTDVVRESEIVREDPALVAPTGLPWWIFNPGRGDRGLISSLPTPIRMKASSASASSHRLSTKRIGNCCMESLRMLVERRRMLRTSWPMPSIVTQRTGILPEAGSLGHME